MSFDQQRQHRVFHDAQCDHLGTLRIAPPFRSPTTATTWQSLRAALGLSCGLRHKFALQEHAFIVIQVFFVWQDASRLISRIHSV
jgi:hypothetical protein